MRLMSSANNADEYLLGIKANRTPIIFFHSQKFIYIIIFAICYNLLYIAKTSNSLSNFTSH